MAGGIRSTPDLREELKRKISRELNVTLQKPGAPFELLFIVEAGGMCCPIGKVLDMLQRCNRGAEKA